VKILICGDSFAANWQVKYPDKKGWPNLLADKYDVTNIAQAAVSEYKILQQIKSIDLSKFDTVLVSHASPNRIHCKLHPIHANNVLHKDSDLIYTDLLAHKDDSDCQLAVDFFERYFELDYYHDISNLICKEILSILDNYELNQIHLINVNKKQLYNVLSDYYDINRIFVKNRGDINHLTPKGNQLMFNKVEELINEKLNLTN